MRRFLPHMALVMAYLLTPGSAEITENIAHLLSNGHLSHVAHLSDAADAAEQAADDHEPTGDEHGCSGPFHVCPCHSSLSFLLAAVEPRLDSTLNSTAFPSWKRYKLQADGFQFGLFRPPIS